MRIVLPALAAALLSTGLAVPVAGPAGAAAAVSSLSKADPANDQVAVVGYRDADRAYWSTHGWTASPAGYADFTSSTYAMSGASGSRVLTITHKLRDVLPRSDAQQQTIYTTLTTGKGLNATVQSSNLGTGTYVYLDGQLRSCPAATTTISTSSNFVRQVVPLSCWVASTLTNPSASSQVHSTSEAKDVASDRVATVSGILR